MTRSFDKYEDAEYDAETRLREDGIERCVYVTLDAYDNPVIENGYRVTYREVAETLHDDGYADILYTATLPPA